MSGGFCGIDPSAMGGLTVRLEWAAADLDSQAGRADERLTRHSRWSVADSVGSHLSTSSRWARTSADHLRRRAAAMESAELLATSSPLLITDVGALAPSELEDWIRGALGVWNGRGDSTFPLGRWVFGDLWINRVAQHLRGTNPIVNGTLHVPSIANGWLSRQAMNTSYFRWISNPAVQTVGKRFSFGLAVASTIGDAKIVWDHGNPIHAFEREGAGYVADTARLGFSGSTAAFLVAPNPVTGGIVIVSGVVWASAEVVDHWDEITDTWNAAYRDLERAAQTIHNTVSEGLSAGWDWTADRWDETVDWREDRIVGLADMGSDLLDAGTDAFDFTKSLLAR